MISDTIITRNGKGIKFNIDKKTDSVIMKVTVRNLLSYPVQMKKYNKSHYTRFKLCKLVVLNGFFL